VAQARALSLGFPPHRARISSRSPLFLARARWWRAIMGSGASSLPKVADQSDADLAAAAAGMSAAEREKLLAALASVDSSGGNGGPSEPPTEAPYLREMNNLLIVFAQGEQAALEADFEKALDIMMNPDGEAAKAKQQAGKDFYNAQCKPLLEKSFKHHDTKDTGVLDKEEAAEFFRKAVNEFVSFFGEVAKAQMKMSIDMMMSMFGGFIDEGDEGAKQAKKEMEAEIKKQLAAMIKAINAGLEAVKKGYLDNKAERDVAAFKVLDTSGEGTIQLVEFLAAFEPESEKSTEFQAALGIDAANIHKVMQERQ